MIYKYDDLSKEKKDILVKALSLLERDEFEAVLSVREVDIKLFINNKEYDFIKVIESYWKYFAEYVTQEAKFLISEKFNNIFSVLSELEDNLRERIKWNDQR